MTDQLKNWGIEKFSGEIFVDSPRALLIEEAIKKGQGRLTTKGALVVSSGRHTGRAAKDKYVVVTPETKEKIWWENGVMELSVENFNSIWDDAAKYLSDKDSLYVTKRSVGAEQKRALKVSLLTELPAHALFSQYLFRHGIEEDVRNGEFTILHAPNYKVDVEKYNLRSDTVVALDFTNKKILITGTLYSGEIKKSIFTVMNYVLPDDGVLPMHSGANINDEGQVSVFFGLSGTGKTTLSTDIGHKLIGDDEHGLSDEGVFNFEGGCFAKTYKLSYETEPGIYEASTQYGSLLENVVLVEKTRNVDFFDKSITENGRSSYPLTLIEELEPSSKGGVPKHIFFLTADAFGVLPPVAKLNTTQAMEYFVLGYTSKLAGTEQGITEPQATFSPFFGAPFMPRTPDVYTGLLRKYLEKYNIDVWLINTGWTEGPFGVGHRYPLHITRKIIRSVQAGKLDKADMINLDYFDLAIPETIEGVPKRIINPKNTWEDQKAYDKAAKDLAGKFKEQLSTLGNWKDS